MDFKYRSEIDGLRAIAVIPVVFFKIYLNFLHVFGAVGETRTLMGKPTRPSTVPVYQFQHDRINYATINE